MRDLEVAFRFIISKEHLHRYMEHAAYLYNTREMNDGDRTLNLIRRADRKRLTYW